MGLLRDGINEVIATTRQNAAPMGIICRHGEARMVVFRGSHTAARIEEEGWVVANFIFDPVLYVRTAFEDLPPDLFISERAGELPVERLAGAEAWAAYATLIERKTDEALVVKLSLLREEIVAPVMHPVNRGFNSIIEATVHATRVVRSGDESLQQLIRHHARLVHRCGGERELEALGLLFGYLGIPEEP
ncbi:MAG: DUF447 family protein [Methanomicrobiales archaeon]|nr:DUF447 family protein [Methanomicrobiales archaeon]NYT21620.1 DUF447 family protein [Methanomicrobiales archaeon]